MTNHLDSSQFTAMRAFIARRQDETIHEHIHADEARPFGNEAWQMETNGNYQAYDRTDTDYPGKLNSIYPRTLPGKPSIVSGLKRICRRWWIARRVQPSGKPRTTRMSVNCPEISKTALRMTTPRSWLIRAISLGIVFFRTAGRSPTFPLGRLVVSM